MSVSTRIQWRNVWLVSIVLLTVLVLFSPVQPNLGKAAVVPVAVDVPDFSDRDQVAAEVITNSVKIYLPVVANRVSQSPLPTASPVPSATPGANPNLLANGSFEGGVASPWVNITNSQITTAESHSGSHSVKLTSQEAAQGWVSVTPGQAYVFSGWFKWVQFTGNQWGYDVFRVTDSNWKEVATINSLHTLCAPGGWNKLALTFTPTTSQVRVSFGMFGPQDAVEMYFDDLALNKKTGNLLPTANPTANVSAGSVPLTVSFNANAKDSDGAIQYIHWDFADGTADTSANPTHTFYSRGTFTVTLRAWDNDGAMVAKTLTVQVNDSVAPFLAIVSPTGTGSYVTSQSAIVLSGTASTPSGTVNSIVWDNLNTDDAGILSISPSASLNWATGTIRLKPGKNEILLTATDSRGKTATAKIVATRAVSGPQISNVSVLSSTVRIYEKYQVRFKLDTLADNYFFRYDDNPPPGIAPKSGVTVEGVFKTPSGATLTQPGFWARQVTRTESNGTPHFYEAANDYWAVRFSPQEAGRYQALLRVVDASGTVTVSVGTFTATPAVKQGFIKVSQADSRYFEFSNGDLFWPIGPALGSNYAQYRGTGQNLERPWMAGLGAYSTNFARWISTAKQMGNEGFDSQLNFREHYPSHELSQEIFYPGGQRIWLGYGDDQFRGELKPNTNYLVKVRLKTVDINGPADARHPYGFMIKKHGWPSATLEQDLRLYPSFIAPVNANRDWHTVVAQYMTTDREGDNTLYPYISLFLDNVTSGRVYIDEFSMREILSDGSLGGEVVRDHRADLHLEVQQRPAAFFDWQVEQGEQNGVFFKYVIQDKRDWVPNHLAEVGIFTDVGQGYYQKDGTKAKWLEQQWWRYLIARWGYSTAVHSWELNNEGSPDDLGHYRQAQDMAKFMHTYDAHRHLATTSFWCCWRPEFWGDRVNYPDVDYADVHKYTNQDLLKDGTLAAYDMAAFQSEDSLTFYASHVGMPMVRGETGIGDPSLSFFSYLAQPNPGIYYHNLLWAQLNAGGMSDPNYWWSQHLDQINRKAISQPFYLFMRDLNINQGGYVDIATDATVSNAKLRILGQKNLARGQAYVWIQNKDHTWRNVMGVDNPTSIVPQSGAITLKLNPNTSYTVKWWNTYTGAVTQTLTLISDSAGKLTLSITNLSDDVAVKIS